MSRKLLVFVVLFVTAVAHGQTSAYAPRSSDSVIDFLSPVDADPLLQQSKTVFVKNGCAYCHGVDLNVRGEAADLRTSAIVAGDVNGNVIGAVLKHGIPQTAKLSPMPQFSDLSEHNIQDIARWIHYARQQSRFVQLTAANQPAGDAHRGEAYFTKTCASCHSAADMTTIVKKKASTEDMRKSLLKPASLNGVQSFKLADLHDEKKNAARLKHGQLLENYSPKDIADLTAYLQTLR
jgi:mono/diheme cytochrome c family protein